MKSLIQKATEAAAAALKAQNLQVRRYASADNARFLILTFPEDLVPPLHITMEAAPGELPVTLFLCRLGPNSK